MSLIFLYLVFSYISERYYNVIARSPALNKTDFLTQSYLVHNDAAIPSQSVERLVF